MPLLTPIIYNNYRGCLQDGMGVGVSQATSWVPVTEELAGLSQLSSLNPYYAQP